MVQNYFPTIASVVVNQLRAEIDMKDLCILISLNTKKTTMYSVFSYKSTTTDVTFGAGTAFPSGALEFSLIFVVFLVSWLFGFKVRLPSMNIAD